MIPLVKDWFEDGLAHLCNKLNLREMKKACSAGRGSQSPCPVEIVVRVTTDNWGYETSWVLKLGGDTLHSANGTYDGPYLDTLCVSAGNFLALEFTIMDSLATASTAVRGI